MDMTFQTESRLSRQKQINTLKVFNELVECVIEGAEYRIKFRGLEQLQLCLTVKLPPDFPAAQPHVYIEPTVYHPWVQHTTGRITQAPGLINFSPHSDLGMVVTAIRREFEKYECLTVVPQSVSQPVTQPVSLVTSQEGVTDSVGAKLSHLSKDELLDVLNNPVAFEKFMLSLSYPTLDNLNDNIKSMEEVVKETVETNIQLEVEIEASRDALLCKMEEYHTKKLSLGQAHAKVKSLKARVEGSVLADKLVRLSVDNEERSDHIADKFLAKEMGVEQFLTDYVKTRQESHLQKLKADKVKEI